MSVKKLAVFVATACLTISAQAQCVEKKELQAFDVRALQSAMMVAALSCGQQKSYNQFVTKYAHQFRESGETIKAYFQHAYGGTYESHLNQFVTGLANKATQRSMMAAPNKYCHTMSERYEDLLGRRDNLNRVARDARYSSLHGMEECS